MPLLTATVTSLQVLYVVTYLVSNSHALVTTQKVLNVFIFCNRDEEYAGFVTPVDLKPFYPYTVKSNFELTVP